MESFIARIKQLIRNETKKEPGYIVLTVPTDKGLKIGDAYIYVEPLTSGKQTVRVFAPLDVSVKRVDGEGKIIERSSH